MKTIGCESATGGGLEKFEDAIAESRAVGSEGGGRGWLGERRASCDQGQRGMAGAAEQAAGEQRRKSIVRASAGGAVEGGQREREGKRGEDDGRLSVRRRGPGPGPGRGTG